uniref:Uncharacterized protein n=1 Tax=Romanomermis culicivorax TaxID=13658 RepID=A0A915KP68_ROMCU
MTSEHMLTDIPEESMEDQSRSMDVALIESAETIPTTAPALLNTTPWLQHSPRITFRRRGPECCYLNTIGKPTRQRSKMKYNAFCCLHRS